MRPQILLLPVNYLTGAGDYISKMGCGVSRSPRVEEAKIKAAVTAKPHASAVARESKGMWSYSIVSRAWRIAGTLL